MTDKKNGHDENPSRVFDNEFLSISALSRAPSSDDLPPKEGDFKGELF